MKVLVTGGAGFIGSYVVEALVERGYEVKVFDDLSTGSLENLSRVAGEMEFVKGDVRDYGALAEHVRGVDAVIHEAAVRSVVKSMEDPLTTYLVNAQGTLNALWASLRSGVRRFIYASSSSIYGDTPTLPKHEDLKPNPLSPYAASKLAGEDLCRVFHKAYGLPTVSLRYFNVYGPRQSLSNPYTGVCAIFISRLLNRKPPYLFEDGGQLRDFIHVSDVAKANLKALESSSCDYQAINVGTGRPTSIKRVAQLLAEALGVEERPLVSQRFRVGDVRHCYADTSRAERLLGFKASLSLEDGLRELASTALKEGWGAQDRFEQSLKELEERGLVG